MLFAASLVFACLLRSALGYCYETGVVTDGQGMSQSNRPGCGLCPQKSCLDLQAIILGYCCGYRQDRDLVPVICDSDLWCPPPSTLLWTDYNYLMDCCC